MSAFEKKEVVAAVDIGGTNTVFALVDRDGRILERGVLPTRAEPAPEKYIKGVSDEILHRLSNYRLTAVGIGAPNGNYFKGTIEFAPNLPWQGVIHLAELFQSHLGVPVFVTNDANAAALGEKYFGSAKEMNDFIFVTLGTGLGSGLVVNGQLVHGHDGFAGELGHTIVLQHGRQCGCGRLGCLEQYCSATGLVKSYVEIVRNSGAEEGKLASCATLTSKDIYELALAGDKDALYAFNYSGEILGFALANSVAYTSPEAVFLFGGLAEAGDLLFQPVIRSFEKNLLALYKGKVKILPSGLPENDAALLGAASHAWNEFLKPISIQ